MTDIRDSFELFSVQQLNTNVENDTIYSNVMSADVFLSGWIYWCSFGQKIMKGY